MPSVCLVRSLALASRCPLEFPFALWRSFNARSPLRVLPSALAFDLSQPFSLLPLLSLVLALSLCLVRAPSCSLACALYQRILGILLLTPYLSTGTNHPPSWTARGLLGYFDVNRHARVGGP